MIKLTTKSMLRQVIPAVLMLAPISLVAQTSGSHMAHSDTTSQQQPQACPMMQMMGSEGMSGGMMGSTMTNNKMSSSGRTMGPPMMEAMKFLPERVLKLRDELSLQPKQVTQLEGLQTAMSTVRQEAMADAPMLLKKLDKALASERPDSTAVRAAAQQMLRRHERMTLSMWTTSAAVKTILTTKQLERLAEPSGHHMSKGTHSKSGNK